VPPRKRKRRPRHHHVTTVPSTGSFLAPRSARRSDASQTQPGGRRAEACGAKGSLAGCGARLRRVQRPAAHAQPGRHRLTSLRAPRVARTPQTQPGSRRAEAGSGAKQRRLAPRSARRSDARFGSPRSARRSDASNAAGRSASGSLRRHRPPARLRRPRVQTQPGRGRSRRSLRRTHARARAAALVSSCVGATRHRSRARPPAAPTLGRGHPNSSFGVRARRRGWASALRAGERFTALTSPPLDQIVRARAPPRALPASHLTECWRMAAKAPRGAIGNPMTRAQR